MPFMLILIINKPFLLWHDDSHTPEWELESGGNVPIILFFLFWLKCHPGMFFMRFTILISRTWLLNQKCKSQIVLVLQVSFRYHCQLYSEWRRTNQKVRLLIPDTKGAHSTQHSLLSTKLLKKTADETIVWETWCRGTWPDRGGISLLPVLDAASSTRAAALLDAFFSI